MARDVEELVVMRTENVASLARRPINRLLRTRLVAGLTSPRNVDDYLQLVDPWWSVQEVRARIVRVHAEADQATSLFLTPNENWSGFRAGQFIQLSVTIAGVRQARCFSVSSAPEDGQPLRLTIKWIPGGRVSSWAKTRARVGDVVTLSPAQGVFVLPDPVPRRLLFVSGGSGITPILSMVRHLAAVGYDGHIGWMHYARREAMFGDELARLVAGRLPLRLSVSLTRPDAAAEAPVRFSAEQLEAFEPAWAECETFVCGPEPLIQAATELWARRSLGGRLHVERFVPGATGSAGRAGGATHRLTFAKSRLEAKGGPGSLLEQAESAGLKPAYGCRMGICHTCTCRKRSGTVRNELTGETSSEADEEIRLCISTPLSDVTLDL
jgi:stearoyl-CoA 9-desaturase NADPH oxidoreductase